MPDGVCNPVRNIFRIAARKRFGRGCKPRPAATDIYEKPGNSLSGYFY
ncbi:Uncharacterized protein dnm_069080 [Desulfonema magnum]|uniref:Uncharacterized protein n=1 Tax=Desulfonema magnum TaxID=45655 RepID=A0A975BSJ1_9BACT|nr:Uncharacterized protein dnm_069080 [Desulfonema magnum]